MNIPELKARYDVDEKEFVLFETMEFEGIIKVPSGFKAQVSTIPWFLKWIIPIVGPHNHAAVLHNYLIKMNIKSVKYANSVSSLVNKKMLVPFYYRMLINAGNKLNTWYYWKKYSKVIDKSKFFDHRVL